VEAKKESIKKAKRKKETINLEGEGGGHLGETSNLKGLVEGGPLAGKGKRRTRGNSPKADLKATNP